MQLRGRRVKFTAVAVLVVLSLTGFSSGHHSKSRSSGGGGGCSSSSQDHDSSSSTTTSGGGTTYHDYDYDDDDYDYDDDDYGSTGSSDSTSQDAEVELLTCADEDTPYATIEVTNLNDQDGAFYANVTFKDVDGGTVDEQGVRVEVAALSVAKAKVPLSEDLLDDVDHCEADPEAVVTG